MKASRVDSTTNHYFCMNCSNQFFGPHIQINRQLAEECCTKTQASGIATPEPFITATGEWTLEQIAIEVGLRKLGCTHDVAHDVKTSMGDGTHYRCSEFDNEDSRTKDQIIQAAFPFEVDWNFKENTSVITKAWTSSTNEQFPESFKESSWTLLNPMLNSSSSRPTDARTPLEPQCVCQMDAHFAHLPSCDWLAWRKNSS